MLTILKADIIYTYKKKKENKNTNNIVYIKNKYL